MPWPFTYRSLLYPKERYLWLKIRILHETDKAILAYSGGWKLWIPKSRINRIRLKNNTFEIYTNIPIL